MPPFLNKMLMKGCDSNLVPHPCDPAKPCDICDEGLCPDPKLCKEVLKNSQLGWQTRCKPGAKISVEVCKAEPEHPCDPPAKCIKGKPKVWPCTIPSLCRERVKNLAPKDLLCHPDPEDTYSRTLCENLELLNKEVKKRPDPSCGKAIYYNPHVKRKKEEAKTEQKKIDPNEWKYSRTLCKWMDLLKTPIPPPPKENVKCHGPIYLDPFADIKELRRKQKCYVEPNPCLLD